MAINGLMVTEIDNRGAQGTPYGYVYFSDESRVGFTPGLDSEVWPSNRGDVTGRHMGLAAQALVQAGLLHTGPVRFRVNHPLAEVVAVEPHQMR